MQAQFLPEEYIQEKLLTINGDIDMLESIQEKEENEEVKRLREAEKRLKEQQANDTEVGE